MRFETIATEVSKRGIATLTLNRLDRGNAFNQIMLGELARQLAALGANDSVRALVLRGAGKHFCAGADVSDEVAKTGKAAGPPVKLTDLLIALDTLPQPTVVVIQGACVGGGFAIASCCDTVLADEGAFFSIPEVRLGFAASALLPIFVRAIGYRNFRRYGLSGERFTAAEALRMGFVHQVTTAAVEEKVLSDLLDALLLGAPGSVRDFKASAARYAMPRLSDLPLAELEQKFDAKRLSSEAIEGIASFRERRKPSWYPPK